MAEATQPARAPTRIKRMNISTHNVPGRIRFESDMHRANIKIKPRRKASAVIVLLIMLLFNGALCSVGWQVAGAEIWFLIAMLMLPLNSIYLWSQRTYKTISITLDAHVLVVEQGWVGINYRIPLVDIESVHLNAFKNTAQLVLKLSDDTILIGSGADKDELRWLQNLLERTIAVAKQRPVKRDGLPEEVPQALRTITEGQNQP